MLNTDMIYGRKETIEALREVSGLLSTSLEAIDEIICSFNKVGNEYVAFKLLSVLFETFDLTIRVLQSSASVFPVNSMESNLNSLFAQLNHMLRCMENEDYILLCDIMGNETVNIVRDIKLSIDEVLQ